MKTIKGILNHCFHILYTIGDQYGLIEPKKGFHSKTKKFLKNISEELSEFTYWMDEIYEEKFLFEEKLMEERYDLGKEAA